MNRTFFAFVLAILSISLVLSGCGGSSSDTPPPGYGGAEVRDSGADTQRNERSDRDKERFAELSKKVADAKASGDLDAAGDIATRTGGSECMLLQQCSSGDDLCWFGKCWTEDELYGEFEPCDNMQCDTPCENCAATTEKCQMATGSGAGMYKICADCFKDNDCDDGFTCETGRCI